VARHSARIGLEHDNMDMVVQEQDGLTRIVLVGQLDIKGAQAWISGSTRWRPRAQGGDRPDRRRLHGLDGHPAARDVGQGLSPARHKIALFGACEPVSKVITTSGLDQIIPLADDWAGAVTILA